MPAYYQWCSSSACADNHTSAVMMPGSVPFPSASFYYDAVQTLTGKGLYWSLHSTYVVAGPFEVSWFRSVYSDQVALQSCKPTAVMSSNGRPPIALQPWGAFDPAVTTAAEVSTKAVPAPVHTFGRIHGSATQAAVKPTSTRTSRQGKQTSSTMIAHDPHEPEHATNEEEQPTSRGHLETSSLYAMVGSITVPIPGPIARSSDDEFGSSAASSTREETATPQAHSKASGPSDVMGSELPSLLTITDSKATTKNKQGGIITLTGRGSATRIRSGGYILGDGQTVSPGGPAATVATVTISIARGGTAVVINGHTSTLSTVRLNPGQVVGDVTVSISRGNVLFHGQTLAITSTLTVGNGSVFTRLALATDSAGHTVLLGDSTTLLVPSGAPSIGSMSDSSMPLPTSSRAFESSVPAQSSQASQSSTSGAQTSQPLVLMLYTIVVAALVEGLGGQLGYGRPYR